MSTSFTFKLSSTFIHLSRKCFKFIVAKNKRCFDTRHTFFIITKLSFFLAIKQPCAVHENRISDCNRSKKENYNNFSRAFVLSKRKRIIFILEKSCKQYRQQEKQQQKVSPVLVGVLREGKALTHAAKERWKSEKTFFTTFTNTREFRKSLFL